MRKNVLAGKGKAPSNPPPAAATAGMKARAPETPRQMHVKYHTRVKRYEANQPERIIAVVIERLAEMGWEFDSLCEYREVEYVAVSVGVAHPEAEVVVDVACWAWAPHPHPQSTPYPDRRDG